MTLPLRSPLSRTGKAALIAAGLCALASPVAAGWLTSPAERQAISRAVALASNPASTLAADHAAASAPGATEAAKSIRSVRTASMQRIGTLRQEPVQLGPVARVTLSNTSPDAAGEDAERLQLAEVQAPQRDKGSATQAAQPLPTSASPAAPGARAPLRKRCIGWESRLGCAPETNDFRNSSYYLDPGYDSSAAANNNPNEQAAAAYFNSQIQALASGGR